MTVIVPYPSPADQRDSHIHCSFCKPWRTRTGCWEAVQIYPGLDQRSWQGPGHRLLWSVVLISACVKLKWKTDLKDQLFKSRFLLNVKKKWLTFTCTIYKRKKKIVCLSSLTGNASQRLVDPQPETRAMMNFIQSHRFTLSVALDGGALVATYPYDKPVQTGNTTMTRNKKYIVYKNLRTPG